MKIGCSDYSFRHEFASKTMNWVDDFPARAAEIGLNGLEITDTNID